MEVRHNWTVAEVKTLLDTPFMDLLFQAQSLHRQYQQHNYVQVSTLLSIKTGLAQKIVNIALKVPDTIPMLSKSV